MVKDLRWMQLSERNSNGWLGTFRKTIKEDDIIINVTTLVVVLKYNL